METGKTRQEWLVLLIGAILLLYFVFRMFTFVVDDAFITYRYAWHLRHGYGPVFNPGERTEGYSCALYMALTALGMVLPGDVLFRAKIIGVVCAACTLWTVWTLASDLRLSRRVRVAIPLLLGANASFAVSAVDGMETSLQAFLVTLAVLLFMRERRTGKGWTSAFVFLAAALNRAEGVIFFVAALLPFTQDVRLAFKRRDALWLGAFLLPMTAFVLWRHAYYGDWLPNTVAAKTMPVLDALDFAQGPSYLLRTIFGILLFPTQLLIVVASISIYLWMLVIRGANSSEVKQGSAKLVVLAVLAQSLVVLRSGGDWMFGWRYMMAVVPLWTLLLAAGVERVTMLAMETKTAAQIARALRLCYGGMLALFMIVGFAFVAVEDRTAQTFLSWAAAGWTTDTRAMVGRQFHGPTLQMADALNACLPAGASIAYSEMGITPYFTPRLRWLDTDGLTDREVAHLETMRHSPEGVESGANTNPGTGIGQLVLRRRPDYLMAQYSAETSLPSVLGGAYVLYRRIPLHHNPQLFDGMPHPRTVLLIWRRRPELDSSLR